MMKYILSGMAVGAALLLPQAISQHWATAQEQTQVREQCSGVTWTGDARFYELLPLPADQLKEARVVAVPAYVRLGAGTESSIAFALNRGEGVTVTGETWDRGCNQWMQIRTRAGGYWMQGNTLELVDTGNRPSPINSGNSNASNPSPSNPRASGLTAVSALCSQATWTSGYFIGELIPLAAEQYKTATVNNAVAVVRSGAGWDSPELFRLQRNSPVIVVGEAWDRGCNQWMRVQIGTERRWVHGNALRLGS